MRARLNRLIGLPFLCMAVAAGSYLAVWWLLKQVIV